MKVGIVGSGFVGSTAAYAMVMQGIGREIVLVDYSPERAVAEAQDIMHAVPFARPMQVRAGDYSDLAESVVVILAAGVNQQPGETRLQLLQRNADVFRQIVPSILENAPNAILVVATNPVDIMTHIAAQFAAAQEVSFERVIGSGTTLDTARFRSLLSQHFGVDARHVHAHVIGEHGDSEVLAWSQATISGQSIDEFGKARGIELTSDDRASIDEQVRRAAYKIIGGKGATYYGIGAALARIVDVIIHNQRSILTVCSKHDDVLGISDVTLAVPQLLGGNGIIQALELNLNQHEIEALRASATVIHDAIESLGI